MSRVSGCCMLGSAWEAINITLVTELSHEANAVRQAGLSGEWQRAIIPRESLSQKQYACTGQAACLRLLQITCVAERVIHILSSSRGLARCLASGHHCVASNQRNNPKYNNVIEHEPITIHLNLNHSSIEDPCRMSRARLYLHRFAPFCQSQQLLDRLDAQNLLFSNVSKSEARGWLLSSKHRLCNCYICRQPLAPSIEPLLSEVIP